MTATDAHDMLFRMPSTVPPKPGSQSALRLRNQRLVIERLLQRGPTTQSEIARATDLSTATVSNIVHALEADGVVVTSPTTSSGRRATLVGLNDPGSRVAIGIDFGRSHVRIVLTSLAHEVVAESVRRLELGYDPTAAIAIARKQITRMLGELGLDDDRVLGVAAGIPGPIDGRTGVVVEGTIIPEWVGYTESHIAEGVGFAVRLGNDADFGAAAEVAWGNHSEVDDLVFVKVGTGIGAGIISGGKSYQGAIGLSGEIGHLTIDRFGPLCHCGNRGCLESVASVKAMSAAVARVIGESVDAERLVDIALQGHRGTLRILADGGYAIGQGVASIASLLNPSVIVIGGPLAQLGELLLGPIRDGMARHTLPTISESTNLVVSSLGERSEALGAATIALQEPGVFATLAQRLPHS